MLLKHSKKNQFEYSFDDKNFSLQLNMKVVFYIKYTFHKVGISLLKEAIASYI